MDFNSYLKEPLPFENEIDKLFENDNPIIFDIGSCEGEDSIRLKRKFPNSTVYSFEPLPKNIQRIKRNFKKYHIPSNNIYQLALSDSDGSAEFYVSSGHPDDLPNTQNWDYGNKSSSLLPPKQHLKTHKWLSFKDKITVKTQRIDNFCREHEIDRIDFAYIDVQGAELMVLKGAGDYLKIIRVIWLEVEAIELYAKQPLKNDVEKFMKDSGFKLIMDTVDNVSGDQLYINVKSHKGAA